MKNPDRWVASKFKLTRYGWRATDDRALVAVGSRLYVDLLACALSDAVSTHAHGRLADLGCGDVPLYGMYKDRTSDVVCVDWSQSRHRISHIDFECDLNQPLPFDDGSFDTLILSDVLEHLCEPDMLWRQMSRVLRNNGRIICSVPFFYWLHESPHDYYRYTEFALRRFAKNNGLEVIELKPFGGSIEVMTDLLAKHLVLLPALGAPLALAMQSVVLRWSRTRIGLQTIGKTAGFIPLGYTIVAGK
jgi:SAM-dependent methyltransferase